MVWTDGLESVLLPREWIGWFAVGLHFKAVDGFLDKVDIASQVFDSAIVDKQAQVLVELFESHHCKDLVDSILWLQSELFVDDEGLLALILHVLKLLTESLQS